MNKQAILDVLNSLEVVDQQGGEDAYMLVDNNNDVREKLAAVGVTPETITQYGDEESFCVLALVFGEGYCDEYDNQNEKFVLWGPLDDDFRYRVLNGQATPMDAERLLRMLEPELCEPTDEQQPNSSQYSGLYNKYQIINRETGQEADGQYFVLKPAKDTAARSALMAYAEATDNQQLAMDITLWLSSLSELAKCDWCDNEVAGETELSHPHMFDMAIGGRMCRHCWEHDREVYKGSYGEDIGEFKPIQREAKA